MKVSNAVVSLQIDRKNHVVWNKYFPSMMVLNKSAMRFLEHEKIEALPKGHEGSDLEVRLKDNHLVHLNDRDPFRQAFFNGINDKLRLIENMARAFYAENQSYSSFVIVNNRCNLACPYCVKRFKSRGNWEKRTFGDDLRLKILELCFSQYAERKIERNELDLMVVLNGGEILLDWDLIKAFVTHNREKFPSARIIYQLNTNLTLMTEDIARFMKDNHFEVSVSIDGYRAAHNRTRHYHDGKGSFEDVIHGLRIINKFYSDKPIVSFQGTIEHVDKFRYQQVFRMTKYGFHRARIAPNLLGASEEDAQKKAAVLSRLFKKSLTNDFKCSETYFAMLTELIERGENLYNLFCLGLVGFPGLRFGLNLDTLRVFHLCSYIDQASLPIDCLGNQIYHPRLWDHSVRFIRQRIHRLETFCADCDMIGICRGGCVMLGLDTYNEINPAACFFQKDFLRRYLKIVLKIQEARRRNKSPEPLS